MRDPRVYTDPHSILELEYLNRGYDVQERIAIKKLPPDEAQRELEICLRYIKARIPEELWDRSVRPRVNREALQVLKSYYENAVAAREGGLGLTLLGSGAGYRTQSLYVVCRELIDAGFECFVVSYDELVFFLKEAWNDILLRRELDQRFLVDFFALVDIPGDDELSSSVRQDLLARFQLRMTQNRPTIFSVNTRAQSMRDITSMSLVGRLVYPFIRVNKPVVVTEIGDIDVMHMDRWRSLDGSDRSV